MTANGFQPPGGRENLESVEFFKHLNSVVHSRCPHALMIAEESTAWPGVTKSPEEGGLGFDFKWNMGWMHDSLSYIEEDPVYRKYHHGTMTFSMVYQYSERFVLPLSHDEVVHGKGSLLGKMPGDRWQKLANLRAYYGFMWAHPGKKLVFMGCEIGQDIEWNHDQSISWDLMDRPDHAGVQTLVAKLNGVYQQEKALQFSDLDPAGFEWAIADDAENSVIAMLRYDENRETCILAISNFTPILRHDYRVGVPRHGRWMEILNSDASEFGGSGQGKGDVSAEPHPAHGREFSINLALPPLATLYLKWVA